jgi:lysyl endopeptidase
MIVLVGCCHEKRIRFILMLTMIWLVGFAAVADTGPHAVTEIQARLAPVESVATWQSPAVDVEALRVEDTANREVPGVPLRIGYPMDTDLTPASSGTWEELPGGDSLWRLRVRTEGALWTVLGFDVFRLQVGAELWVYDPALATALGPYTSRDIRSHGELWFPPIAGDELIVEVYWPAALAGEVPDLHLGTVSHGYEPFGVIGRDATAGSDIGTTGFGDSGSCNIDVACPLGDDWRDQIRGAVILLSGGSSFCSGSLINTTDDDCRPYVLTASHCHAGASTTFGFNFERPECNAGTPLPPTNQVVNGATVLANYAASDFTLL